MNKNLYLLLFVSLSLFFSNQLVLAQGLTNGDYKKAEWMTARMYGGQRSGDGPNWLTMDHTPLAADLNNLTTNKGAIQSQFVKGKDFTKDADGTNSLSGGWVDCGDHVKFGQTYFYAAYTLIKGYAEFPAGYDDLYTANYSDYQAAGDFTYEGGKGKPNGIPDILDELKYECDFFIKCTPNASTFYSQVGNGDVDHLNWVTAPVMAILPKTQGGQNNGARDFVKNAVDASMSSNCAATLALMSRVYAKFDPAYAATCLTHAVYAYTYAKNNPGTVSAGSYYPANAHWEDDYASACAELYWATGNASYKTEALGLSSKIKDHNYCYNYNNNDDVAAYNLAKLGDAASKTLLQTFVTRYLANVTGGIYNGGDNGWGSLRYPANAAFIVGLWGVLNKSTTVDAFIYNQIDYILGKNSSNFSFVVGFKKAAGGTYVVHPHHRNVYLINDITANQSTMVIPTHNTEHGYLIGGARTVPFTESATDYKTSEGGIDYNAGLVGALGYILSRLAPIDTNKFGHPTAQLGSNQSMCGVSSILLDSKVKTDGKKTFTWKKDGTTVVTASTTATTFSATAAGVYICQIDSTGWSTTGSVTLTAVLPTISLGADAVLCNPATDTLNTGISGSGITFQWKKNGTAISGATTSSYIATAAGTYICTISATGCTSVADTVAITSTLPTVVNDTICAAGVAPLSVTSTGTYAWYNVATGGTVLATGSTYSPSITASTTYYVQDAGSVSLTVAPVSGASSLTGATNGGNVGVKITASKAFTITSMNILPYVYSCGSTDKISITIDLQDGTGTKIASYTSSQVACTGVQSGAPFNTYYTVTFNPAISITAAGNYILMPNGGNALVWFNGGANFTTMSSAGTGVISITGTTRTDVSNNYPGIFDIKVQAGSSCARAPIQAVINPLGNCGDTQAPTTPGAVTFGTVTSNSIIVNWGASTDNIAVTAYEVYMNGVLQTTVTSGTTTTITGLTCNTAYAFKVRAKDAAGNTSAFTTEVSQSTTVTAAPTVTTPVNYCQNSTASALTATGTALKWYTVATAGTALTSTPVPTTTTVGTTNYYVSQTVSSCESSRTTLAVTINALPTISAGTAVAICAGKTASLTASGGISYNWNTGATSTSITVVPTTTTTYFVTGSNAGGCSTTGSVVVTVNSIPAAPTVVTPVNYTLNTTATALTATGSNLLWYNAATAGTVYPSTPIPVTTVSGTTNYYVSQTVNACESPRAILAVIVSANIPPTISITAPANNANYTAPAAISLKATAVDADGTITSVKYYNGTTLLTTITASPYNYAWSAVPAGTYSITAVATDNSGATTTSSIITIIVYSQQSIALSAGWNIISFNTQPADSTIATVFAAFGSNLLTIKNQDGFYDPSQPAINNSLLKIEQGKGYMVDVKASQTLSVIGIATTNCSIALKTGWNLVGYPKQSSTAISSILSGIWTPFVFIKNFDGFYQNGGTTNSLTNFVPGSGYFLKVSSACTLSY
jgi:hypothetical protein